MAIDLHLHTTASDGAYTPTEIVDKAKDVGLEAIGITDHDNMNGVEEACKRGEEVGVEIVPGVELNTDYEDIEVHVLGYYLDYSSSHVQEVMNKLVDAREERARKIVKNLNQQGINISYEQVAELAGDGAIGRPHIARILMASGYVEEWGDAFNKYIGRDCPAYVPRTKLTPFEAVELILEAGGVPVIAHPGLNNVDKIIPSLIEVGLMGIEVYHYEHNSLEKKYYLKMANKHNLLVTGGSDCHGPGSKSGVKVGQIKLRSEILDELKKARDKVRK